MPTLKWQLKDPKSCEGCDLLLQFDYAISDSHCGKDYWRNGKVFNKHKLIWTWVRPQACIDELEL